jgi:hypothetical protein
MPAQKMSRRQDGRYVKKIKDPRTGKDVYFYGKTIRELNEKVLSYQCATQNGRKFKEVAEEWWEIAEPSLAHQSIRVYKPALQRAINEFGDEYIKEIRAREITAFLSRLARNDMAQKTLLNQRTVINQILRHAVNENDIEHNPCSDV